MEINPIIPPTGPPSETPTSPLSGTSGGTATPQTLGDEISAAIYVGDDQTLSVDGRPLLIKPNDELTLLSFAALINKVITEFKHLLGEMEVVDALQAQPLHQLIAGRAASLREILVALVEFAATWRTFVEEQNSQIDLMNAQITNINNGVTADQNEIDLINTAIDDYNAGNITATQYDAAVTRYNNYITSRKGVINAFNNRATQFNNQIAQNNTTIQNLNDQKDVISLLGIPDIGTQTGQQQQFNAFGEVPDSSTAIQGSIPNVANPTSSKQEIQKIPDVPSDSDLIEQYYTPFFLEEIGFLDLLRTSLTLSLLNLENQQVFLANNLNFALPNSFINDLPESFLESVGSAGAGTSIAALALGLTSPNLERVLARALFESVSLAARFPLSGRILDELQLFALQALGQIGLLAGLPAAVLLGDQLARLGRNSPAITAAISLSLAHRLQDLLSTNVIRNATINLARRILGPGASFGRALSVAATLSAVLNLSLLRTGLAQVALSLGLPGLTPLLLANVAGLSTLDILLASTAGSRLNEVLRNPLAVLFLKATLSDKLAFGIGLNVNTAQALVNVALNNVLALGFFRNSFALRNSLFQEFRTQGLNPIQSLALANSAIALINADLGIPSLDTAFVLSSVNRGALGEALTNRLIAQGFDVGFAGSLINTAILATLAKDFQTMREFRNDLATQLANGGLGLAVSFALANSAAEFILTGSIAPFVLENLRQDILEGSLINVLTGLGSSREAAAAIVGLVVAEALAGGSDDLREALRTGFLNQGFPRNLARTLALAALIEMEQPNINPLLALGFSDPLALKDLQKELRIQIESGLSSHLSTGEAKKFAEDFVDLLTNRENSSSFLSLLEEIVEMLRGLEDNRAYLQFKEELRDFIFPTPDLMTLLRNTTEPAFALLNTFGPVQGFGQTKKTIDMPV